jgi:hypothetical protein
MAFCSSSVQRPFWYFSSKALNSSIFIGKFYISYIGE